MSNLIKNSDQNPHYELKATIVSAEGKTEIPFVSGTIIGHLLPPADASGEPYIGARVNNEVASQLVNAIKFVKTMEATSLDDITKGNIFCSDAFYENALSFSSSV